MKTLLLDIARGSTHDGPGIRTTVFVKGCPLRCQWCHNPESQSFGAQLSFNDGLCMGCRMCVEICPNQIHSMAAGQHNIDYKKCISCGECAKICPSEALKVFGYSISADAVMEIIQRDKTFYGDVGGATISGGEPLAHPDFCIELLTKCRQEGIHTCVETSGAGDKNDLKKIAKLTDLFLFDWKISNEDDALEKIGISSKVIRENLTYLMEWGVSVILRCPIIPGINDTVAHFDTIIALLAKYPTLSAEMLPYHNFGISKSKRIGETASMFTVPTKKQKEEWMAYFKDNAVEKVTIS